MNIIEQVEKKYRDNPKHGIMFSIDSSAYDCILGDRVVFGDNTTDLQCGTFYNWQDVILDGKVIGYLKEAQSGRMFDPMTISFCVPIADCTEHELWERMESEYKDNPHLYDAGEVLELRFATLNQMLDYLKAA